MCWPGGAIRSEVTACIVAIVGGVKKLGKVAREKKQEQVVNSLAGRRFNIARWRRMQEEGSELTAAAIAA